MGHKDAKSNIRIVQINVEGMSRSKAEIINQLFGYADVLAIQETHVTADQTKRLNINGFQLVSFTGHPKHGIAPFVNHNVQPQLVKPIEGNDHTIGIRVGNLSIYNVYKPPSENWPASVLPTCEHPSVYIGDFNSHSTKWGYNCINDDGERLSTWESVNNAQLIYDAKQGGTFESGRWGTATSPDLCFVSKDNSDKPLRINRKLGRRFPKSQHRPAIVEVGVVLPRIKKPAMQRWNVRKADWNIFRAYIEENVNRIEPSPKNYERFVKLAKPCHEVTEETTSLVGPRTAAHCSVSMNKMDV